jgi:hypothetical protein
VAVNDGAGHQGVAAITFYRASTVPAIAQQRVFTSGPALTPCLWSSAAQDSSRYPWLGPVVGPDFALSVPPVALHQPGDAELLTLTRVVGGSPQSAFWAFTHLYVGRYEAVVVVSWCSCKPLPTADLQHVDDVAGAHLAALAAKSP